MSTDDNVLRTFILAADMHDITDKIGCILGKDLGVTNVSSTKITANVWTKFQDLNTAYLTSFDNKALHKLAVSMADDKPIVRFSNTVL